MATPLLCEFRKNYIQQVLPRSLLKGHVIIYLQSKYSTPVIQKGNIPLSLLFHQWTTCNANNNLTNAYTMMKLFLSWSHLQTNLSKKVELIFFVSLNVFVQSCYNNHKTEKIIQLTFHKLGNPRKTGTTSGPQCLPQSSF